MPIAEPLLLARPGHSAGSHACACALVALARAAANGGAEEALQSVIESVFRAAEGSRRGDRSLPGTYLCAAPPGLSLRLQRVRNIPRWRTATCELDNDALARMASLFALALHSARFASCIPADAARHSWSTQRLQRARRLLAHAVRSQSRRSPWPAASRTAAHSSRLFSPALRHDGWKRCGVNKMRRCLLQSA
jgi:hypothetical protein